MISRIVKAMLITLFVIFSISIFLNPYGGKGRDLIQNARIAATSNQLEEFQTQLNKTETDSLSIDNNLKTLISETFKDGTTPVGGEIEYARYPFELPGAVSAEIFEAGEYYLLLKSNKKEFLLNPIQVAQIDRRIDDGKPDSGKIIALGSKKCIAENEEGMMAYTNIYTRKKYDIPFFEEHDGCANLYMRLDIRKGNDDGRAD